MLVENFKYVEIGTEKNKRLILCKEVNYSPSLIQKVARIAFPEIFPKYFSFLFTVPARAWDCQRMISSQFDGQVFDWKIGNDWDRFRFVALNILEKSGKTICRAQPVNV